MGTLIVICLVSIHFGGYFWLSSLDVSSQYVTYILALFPSCQNLHDLVVDASFVKTCVSHKIQVAYYTIRSGNG